MPVMISWNRAGQVGITDRPDRQAGVPRESRETCGNRWTMTMSPPHRNRADYFPGHQRVLVFRSAIIYLALSLVQQPGPSCPATLRKRLYCTSYSLSATRPPSRTSVELCGDHHLLDDKTSQDFCYKRYIAAALHREETEGFCGFGLVASSRSVPLPLLAT